MKAILVIRMPNNCTECQILEYNKEIDIVCRHTCTGDSRPSWCPLKPLPLKRKSEVGWFNESQSIKTHELTCYDRGWNDCIDFIEGGENALEEEN